MHDIVILLIFGALVLAPCFVALKTGVHHHKEEK